MSFVRSAIYVPADNERLIRSAGSLSVDSIMLDLEDGVAPSAKAQARSEIAETVSGLDHSDIWLRINPGEEGLADLEAAAAAVGLKGIWIAKAEPGPAFQNFVTRANELQLKIGVLIESARGYVHRVELLEREEVSRVQIGEYDLGADLGLGESARETFGALDAMRVEIVAAAVSGGVDEILAGVSSNFSDLDAYRASTTHLKQLGFTGRACIHPRQVEISQRLFAPSAAELEWARTVVERFEAEIASGRGAYRDDSGQMADAATVRKAKAILARAS